MPMPEDMSISVTVTDQEAETLYKASRGQLLCPRCNKPLKAEICLFYHQISDKEMYRGVNLKCRHFDPSTGFTGCGFEEH